MLVLETLSYLDRNRRADVCVIETLIELTAEEERAISAGARDYCRQLESAFRTDGILIDADLLSTTELKAEAADIFAFLYTNTAVAIQRAAGHRVSFTATIIDPNPNQKRAVFEYEQLDVGERAGDLALKLLTDVIPAISWADCPEELSSNFSELFNEFKKFAQPFILPADTQAIINAAARLDVPCVKLDREPYGELTGDFRIRNNGLLKLGHSVYQHIVDGTFCIDKGEQLLPLTKDRERLFQALAQLQVPLASRDDVERHLEGEMFKIIVANNELIGVVSDGSGKDMRDETHPSTLRLVLSIARRFDVGILVADVVSTDIASPLAQNGGAIADVDIAPQLDGFLPSGCELHEQAMTELVRWLYPEGARSRIPTVAITGTNGKTTTSRMITNIMQTGGFRTGLACSDGVYINETRSEAGDLSGIRGHHRVFESPEVNLGVLETSRGALAHGGLAFDWCNVSVCTNVTEDHLGEYGIETVAQMAELKRSVLESAKDAVVLNADDAHCIDMLPFLSAARVCLVSMQSGVEELVMIDGNKNCFSVLEQIGETDWLVLYDGGQRMPIIEVGQIPATFDGTARFNVSNSMHAIAATYLLGIDIESLRTALGNFIVSQSLTPGRLNFFDDLPFRIILDFAHNPDGVRRICEFVDQQNATGRKLIAFSGGSKRTDAQNKRTAQAVAGHFDYYFCKDYEPSKPPKDRFTGPQMQQDLIEEGVPREVTTVLTFGKEVVFKIFDACEPGDLLLFLVGNVEKVTVPGFIQKYRDINPGKSEKIRP